MIGIMLKSIDQFGEIDFLTVSSLSIHDMMSLSIYLVLNVTNGLYFPVYRSCTSFVKFIHNYFIFFMLL